MDISLLAGANFVGRHWYGRPPAPDAAEAMAPLLSRLLVAALLLATVLALLSAAAAP